MEFGADYLDLAEFYWKSGDKEKSTLTAKKGLKKAKGHMDELRVIMAERAKESGNRTAWLELQFDQTIKSLSLKKIQRI